MAPAICRSFRGTYRAAFVPAFPTTESLTESGRRQQQVLRQHAQLVANRYSGDGAAVYQDAVKTLRAPYWDWASSPGLPAAATAPAFLVNSSVGVVNLRNPLYSYQFQDFPFTDPDFTAVLAQFNETKRCTGSGPGSDGVNDFADATWNLTTDGREMQDLVVCMCF